MIEQRAIITRTEQGFAWIEAQRETSCGSCSAQKGCGTGILAKSIGRRFISMKVLNPIGAEVGDEVVVGLPEYSFLTSAFLTYLLPLILMFFGAIAMREISDIQLLIGLGGLGGIALGWIILRRHVRRLKGDPRSQPVVIRKLQPNITINERAAHTIHTTF